METARLLARIVGPRPNGSEALERTADTLIALLGEHTPHVATEVFRATPHGFALVWTAVLGAAVAYAISVRRRPSFALAMASAIPVLLLLEFEWLRSPVSGLWPAAGRNVIATFPGRPDGPRVAFTAHYDTATHFGDHFDWPRIGWWFGPTTGLAVATALVARRARRRGARPSGLATTVAAVALLLPAGGMAFCHALGPILRTPSPGALDNAGAVAVLVRLARDLAARPAGAATTVQLVFFAGEEERALGSWAWAASATRDGSGPEFAVNLECVGTGRGLGWVPEDGFTFRRWPAPRERVRLLEDVAHAAGLSPLVPVSLPPGSLTDGRSLLAHGIPTVTLLSAGGIPRGLHSPDDDMRRLDPQDLERTADLLLALVARLDAEASRR